MAQLWDAASGRPIGPPMVHQGKVDSVKFRPDGMAAQTTDADGTGWLWSISAPVEGEVERLRLWVQVITGLELDDHDAFRVLDTVAWQDRRRKLDQLGGPPAP